MGVLSRIKKGRENLPPRLMIYGGEGIGKSTFAAGAPSPVFIQTEDGLGGMDVARFDLATKYPDVIDNIRGLRDEEHEFQTVVIDSVDWLERLIHDHVVQQDGATSIEMACGGYGRGYRKALDHFRDVLTALDDRYSPRLHKEANALLCEWVDAVLFATRRTTTRTSDEQSGKRVLATSVGKDGAERVLRVSGTPACLAKNRFGLSGELPLSWDAFFNAINGER